MGTKEVRMRSNRWVIGVFVVLSFFLSSCKKTPSGPEGEELVRVGDRVITREQFHREMDQLPQFLKPLLLEEGKKREFLNNLIDRELLLLEASKRGLDKDEEILNKVERFKKGLIIEALLQDLFRGKDEVKEEEIEEYYREHKKDFFVGERIRVRHIVVRTLEEAREIKRRLEEGEDFVTLAKKYSISPAARKGGDLGYIERGKVGKEFEKAAFALKNPGDISDIVKTSFGYHIIRLEDRKEPHQKTLDEAREEIRKILREKKRERILKDYLAKLREKYRVVINESLLEKELKK